MQFLLWNPVSWALELRTQLKESGILPRIGIQISSSIDKYWNPIPGIRNPRCGIQNPRLSWIPLHEANCQSNQAGWKKGWLSIGLCDVCSLGFGCTIKCNLEAIYILGNPGAVGRVEKTFVAPFLSTQLTAPGFPRMYIASGLHLVVQPNPSEQTSHKPIENRPFSYSTWFDWLLLHARNTRRKIKFKCS